MAFGKIVSYCSSYKTVFNQGYHSSLDSLTIYDGDTNVSRVLGQYCGNSKPPTYITSSNNAFVQFHTDDSIRKPGFKILYDPYSKDEFYSISVPKHIYKNLTTICVNVSEHVCLFVCLSVCVLSPPGPLDLWKHEWYHVVTNCHGHVLSQSGLPKVKKSQN